MKLSNYILDLSKDQVNEWSKDWNVQEDGTMISLNGKNYQLTPAQLIEKDLILHMLSKDWVNMNTFIPAYFHALKLTGKSIISIQTYYREGEQ